MYNNFSPYYQQTIQGMQPQMNRQQPYEPFRQYNQQPSQFIPQTVGLQGKSVDNIDVVKAMDIPLDGTVSYFPLADGSAIITKQLMQDGTSKTMVYRPSEKEDIDVKPKYVTTEEFNENIKKYDNTTLKEDVKNLKRAITDIKETLEDMKEERADRRAT